MGANFIFGEVMKEVFDGLLSIYLHSFIIFVRF